MFMKTRAQAFSENPRSPAVAGSILLHGQRYVVVAEADYRRILQQATDAAGPAIESAPRVPLPALLPSGNYPAVQTIRAMLANKIIDARLQRRLSQAHLAQIAGIPAATLNRIERAKVNASPAMADRIMAALQGTTRSPKQRQKSRKRKVGNASGLAAAARVAKQT
jgi:DNA-binding XRE family transcriptional regulator